MIKAMIVGASGYAGAELANYLQRHPAVILQHLTVSVNSADGGKLLSDLYPQLKGLVDLPLLPTEDYAELLPQIDVVFLATDHAVSHQLAPQFLAAGCTVLDLSGAYRLKDLALYRDYYGFEHHHPELLAKAVYGLAEWQGEALAQAELIAVPGCYPTAAQLALKPLLQAELLETNYLPIIDAISGVSGAGRKASLNNSFCEVSLQAYAVFKHRHQPEISQHLQQQVIFTPHLGSFARGIHATIHCRLKPEVNEAMLAAAYQQAYQAAPLVRLYPNSLPALKAVVNTPFCDIGFMQQQQHLIVVAVEDNLLKGAAAQAIQCFNLRFGLPETLALL